MQTPNYFWNLTLDGDRQGSVHRFDIARQVRALNPDVRLVLSLRDPVDRAVSIVVLAAPVVRDIATQLNLSPKRYLLPLSYISRCSPGAAR
jgi:hypothetical protein